VTHTDFAKETRVVFVEVDAMVVLATRVTATTRVLAVLSNAALTVGHIAASLPGLLQACRLSITSDDQIRWTPLQ